jgi:hypothetical protein
VIPHAFATDSSCRGRSVAVRPRTCAKVSQACCKPERGRIGVTRTKWGCNPAANVHKFRNALKSVMDSCTSSTTRHMQTPSRCKLASFSLCLAKPSYEDMASRPRSCINVFHVSTPANNKHLNPTFSSCEKMDGTTFSRSTVDVCSTASCTRALYGHAITTKVPESMNVMFQTTKSPACAGVAKLPGRCDSDIAYLPFPLLVG